MDWIVVDNKKIRVHRQGAGPKILYLHSAAGEVGQIELFDRLAAAGYEVIVPELAGFGDSDPAPEWRSINDVVFHLRRMLDVLELDQPVIIGSSLGGWLAAEIAVWFPKRLQSLVLIDAAGLRVEGAPVYSVFPLPGWDMAELTRLSNPHGFDHAKVSAQLNADVDADTAMVRALRSMEVLARIGWNPYLHDPRLAARLQHVTAPALILWGAEDGLVPLAHGERYAELIPNARLTIVPQSGHSPALEQPERTAQEILAFINPR